VRTVHVRSPIVLTMDLSAVLIVSHHAVRERSILALPERLNRATCVGQSLVLTHLEFGFESFDADSLHEP
jgi:hypothetical protein